MTPVTTEDHTEYTEWRILWKTNDPAGFRYLGTPGDSGHLSEEAAHKAATRQTNTLAAGWTFRLQSRTVRISSQFGPWV